MTSLKHHPLLDSSTRIQRALWFLTWGIPLVCAGIAIWIFSSFALDQRRFADVLGERSSNGPISNKQTTARDGAVTSYAVSEVWERDWRLPSSRPARSTLAASEKPTAAEVPVPKVQPTIVEQDSGLRLIGTFVEKDRSMGLAISPDGSLTYFREGEVIEVNSGKISIQRITSEAVVVSQSERRMDWPLGQSLKLASTMPVPPTSLPVLESPSDPKTLPMGLNQELDLLNGPK